MSIVPGNNITITGSNIVGSLGNFIIRTPSTNSSDTFDIATNIQLSVYGENNNNYNGNSIHVSIYNNSAFFITLNPGTGNTLLPESPLLILPNVINEFIIIQTSDSTNTIYLNSIGSSSDVSDKSLTSGSIIVGNSNNIASQVTMSGDASINNTGTLTLSNTSVVPNSYTNPSLTVDSKGRITSASNGSSTIVSFYGYGPTAPIGIPSGNTTAYTTITTYNAPVFDSSFYSYSAGVVTVLTAGNYEICYTVQFNSFGNTGTTIGRFQSRLLLNGATEVPGSVTECSLNRIAGTNNRSFNSKSWVVSCNANDTYELQYGQTITTTPAQVTTNQCVFTVKKLV